MRSPPDGGIVADCRLLHYNRSGVGRYLRHLYRAVAALGHAAEVTVLYSRRDRERALDGAIPRAATAWTPPHHRLERWTLAAEGARLRPRLWHAPDHVCPQPLGWRTVVTVHDLAFWRLPQTHSPESRAYYAGLWRSVRQAQRVICVSQATRRDLLEATGVREDRVRVVYQAPDPRYLVPDGPPGGDGAPTGDGPPGGGGERGGDRRPYFLCVGTVEPRKNLEAVFRALATLPEEGRPEVRVVGAPGFGAAEIMALPARLGVASCVRFLGRLPTAEVARLYRGALALIYPSLLEGFGIPVLEAMACGAPVIGAGRSSIPEVTGGAALLVDPSDVDSLAGAMERVSTDATLRARLRSLGVARAAEFSWERTARETLAVFAEALR